MASRQINIREVPEALHEWIEPERHAKRRELLRTLHREGCVLLRSGAITMSARTRNPEEAT